MYSSFQAISLYKKALLTKLCWYFA